MNINQISSDDTIIILVLDISRSMSPYIENIKKILLNYLPTIINGSIYTYLVYFNTDTNFIKLDKTPCDIQREKILKLKSQGIA